MEYIYASLLLHSAGKGVNEAGVKKILEAAGITPDEAKVKVVVSSLSGVNIDEELKKAASTPMAVAPVQQQAEQKVPEKKKEEDVEKKAESAAEGLSALFG